MSVCVRAHNSLYQLTSLPPTGDAYIEVLEQDTFLDPGTVGSDALDGLTLTVTATTSLCTRPASIKVTWLGMDILGVPYYGQA